MPVELEDELVREHPEIKQLWNYLDQDEGRSIVQAWHKFSQAQRKLDNLEEACGEIDDELDERRVEHEQRVEQLELAREVQWLLKNIRSLNQRVERQSTKVKKLGVQIANEAIRLQELASTADSINPSEIERVSRRLRRLHRRRERIEKELDRLLKQRQRRHRDVETRCGEEKARAYKDPENISAGVAEHEKISRALEGAPASPPNAEDGATGHGAIPGKIAELEKSITELANALAVKKRGMDEHRRAYERSGAQLEQTLDRYIDLARGRQDALEREIALRHDVETTQAKIRKVNEDINAQLRSVERAANRVRDLSRIRDPGQTEGQFLDFVTQLHEYRWVHDVARWSRDFRQIVRLLDTTTWDLTVTNSMIKMVEPPASVGAGFVSHVRSAAPEVDNLEVHVADDGCVTYELQSVEESKLIPLVEAVNQHVQMQWSLSSQIETLDGLLKKLAGILKAASAAEEAAEEAAADQPEAEAEAEDVSEDDGESADEAAAAEDAGGQDGED